MNTPQNGNNKSFQNKMETEMNQLIHFSQTNDRINQYDEGQQFANLPGTEQERELHENNNQHFKSLNIGINDDLWMIDYSNIQDDQYD